MKLLGTRTEAANKDYSFLKKIKVFWERKKRERDWFERK